MVAFYVAVIVLMATLLAGVALMRSTDTSNVIAGSLTFRQGLVQEAERAYESAKAQIPFFPPAADADQWAVGYSAKLLAATTRADIPDVLAKTPFSCAAPCVMLPAGTTANTVHYVVERICADSGPADPKNCIVPAAAIIGGQTIDSGADPATFRNAVLPAYRLTVRVDGPKGTLGYIQTFLR